MKYLAGVILSIIILSCGGITEGQEAPPTPEVSLAGTGTIEGKITAKPSRYRKDVVVYIKEAAGEFKPPAKNPAIDQKNLVFIPHVLPVVKGTTVDFLNSDTVRHNVFSPDGAKYNLGTWPKGEIRSYTFKKMGTYVQLCNVHPEMEAYVVVLPNPFSTVTDKEGNYRLEGVPPGKYILKTWSDKLRSDEKPVTVVVGKTVTQNFSLRR